MGDPFLTVFSLSGVDHAPRAAPPWLLPSANGAPWWVAEYDNSGKWIATGWRRQAIHTDRTGLNLNLFPTAPDDLVSPEVLDADDGTLRREGKTTKPFTSGQIQRGGWYGYGRYEVVMEPSAVNGLISAFYVYTGPYFGDSHEEIDIEFLGKDTRRIHLNTFTDGRALDDPPWIELGFDAAEHPTHFAFEWRQDAVIWEVDGTEVHRISEVDLIPRPPAKIYIDLWAGAPGLANWSGRVADDARGEMLVQCASYSPLDVTTPQCSDLMPK